MRFYWLSKSIPEVRNLDARHRRRALRKANRYALNTAKGVGALFLGMLVGAAGALAVHALIGDVESRIDALLVAGVCGGLAGFTVSAIMQNLSVPYLLRAIDETREDDRTSRLANCALNLTVTPLACARVVPAG